MDDFRYYHDGSQFHDKENGNGGNRAFVFFVIFIVILLLALIGLAVWTQRTAPADKEASAFLETPTPDATAAPTPQTTTLPDLTASGQPVLPEITATPRTTNYDLPDFDGIAPGLELSENPIPDIYDAVSSAVIGVLNYQEVSYFGRTITDVYASGSGFIVSSSGYVLTNAHVVEGAAYVTVLLADRTEIDAEIIGVDKETDIAVLRISADSLTPVALGDSDSIRVGEYVLAIGNPLDSTKLSNTLTFGIISAKSREITIDNYTNTYIQTDAAINFGNSGGPLLNLNGEVIGMNSAKSVTAGYDAYGNAISAEGIGFALPINKVKTIMQALITEGTVTRPGIGITVTTVTDAIAEAKELPIGAWVQGVIEKGPADLGGVKANDVIVETNGIKITEQDQLVAIIQGLTIGDSLNVRVFRAGSYLDLTIIIADKSQMDFGVLDATPTPEIEPTPTPEMGIN